MKFLVDQRLPPALARWLVEKGHDAEHVFWAGLGEAADSEMWQRAYSDGLIVVTKDSDFAERRLRRDDGPTIVWLRAGNTANSVLLTLIADRWAAIEVGLNSASPVIEVR